MSEIIEASKVRKTEFAGVGCLLQAIGLACVFFWFPVGALIGVALLWYGSTRSTYWACGHCQNRLDSADVRICPVCHATLLDRR